MFVKSVGTRDWNISRMKELVRVILVLLLIVFTAGKTSQKQYEGHKVLRIKPGTEENVETIADLENELQLDFWHMPHGKDGNMDVHVSGEYLQKLKDKLQEMKVGFTELVTDLQRLVDIESQSQRRLKRATNLVDFTTRYLSYNEINNFLDQIVSSTPNAELTSIGNSYEGRNTLVIKLGTPVANVNKPAIFIDAGFHAREWIAPATAINFIYQLAKNPSYSGLLNKFDFYIAPIVNPDGYEYSRSRNRLWRKNRRPSGGNCYGVDINRNFGYEWDPSRGGSYHPCSDLFAGEAEFSEPESRNIRDFLFSHMPQIKGYLTLHSYGQYWLYPWGYSRDATALDEQNLDAVATAAVNAMTIKPYTIGASAKVLYVAAGGSDDFAKGMANVPYSYTVELPPASDDTRGFVLPASEIPRVATDAMRGLVAYSNSLYSKLNPQVTPPSYYTPFFQQLWWNYYYGNH